MPNKSEGLVALCLCAGFAAALFYHGSASALIGPALLFPCLAAWMVLRGAPAIRFDGPVIALILFWAVLLLSRIGSQSEFFSDLFLGIFALMPLLIIALPAKGEGTAHLCAKAMLAALGLLAAITLGQFLFFSRTLGPRIHWPLLDPNNLAALMDIGLLAAAAEAMAADGRRRRGWLGAAGLFIAGLAATQSRDGVAAAIGSLILLCTLPIRAWAERRRAVAAVVALLVAVPLMMEAYGRLLRSADPAGNLLDTGSRSVTDRLALLTATLHMIAVHPWRGTGVGTFSVLYPRYRLPADMSDGFFAHNDALQLWAEAGVLAPLLAAAFIVAASWKTWRRWPPDARERAGAAAGFAALAAVTAQSLVTYELYLPAVLLPLAVLLARWRASLTDDAPARPAWRWRGLAAGTALVICALWLVRIDIGVIAANGAAAAEGRGDIAAEHRDADIATLFAPQDFFPAPQYEARWRILALATGSDLSLPTKQALFNDGLLAARRAENLAPGFAYLRLAQARLFAGGENAGLLPGGIARAEVAAADVLRDDPLCLEARYFLAGLYQGQGQLQKALDVMGEALNWPAPLGQPEIDLDVSIGKLCDTLGDQKCAIDMFGSAAQASANLKTANSPSR